MLSNRLRIGAPFMVTGLIAAGALLPNLRASASPNLPAISPQQLVQKALTERVSHLSGTYVWRADLGLPSLSGLTGESGQGVSTSSGFTPTALLSGTHTFNVWIDGAGLQRIAAPGTLSETDLVRRGDQAWLYDSSTNHVTHYYLRGHSGSAAAAPASRPSVSVMAADLLRQVHSIGTDVSVGRAVEVAGHAAYVLRLAPDRDIAANRASTVAAATIAVDATTGLALRVSIYAVGQSSPALQVGFSSLSYATPSASTFAIPKAQTSSTKILSPSEAASGHRSGHWVQGSTPASKAPHGAIHQVRPAPTSGWGTISNVSSGQVTSGPASRQLDSVTTFVSGPWGGGRLLQSTLVNALFLPNGRVLVGLVTPAALEATAGHLSH